MTFLIRPRPPSLWHVARIDQTLVRGSIVFTRECHGKIYPYLERRTFDHKRIGAGTIIHSFTGCVECARAVWEGASVVIVLLRMLLHYHVYHGAIHRHTQKGKHHRQSLNFCKLFSARLRSSGHGSQGTFLAILTPYNEGESANFIACRRSLSLSLRICVVVVDCGFTCGCFLHRCVF